MQGCHSVLCSQTVSSSPVTLAKCETISFILALTFQLIYSDEALPTQPFSKCLNTVVDTTNQTISQIFKITIKILQSNAFQTKYYLVIIFLNIFVTT